jgi:DNA-binding NarL/FixJ family response regulator/two-component sensor histidine kinase
MFIKLAHETKTPLTLINNYLERYITKKGINDDIKIVKQNIEKLTDDMIKYLNIEKLIRGDSLFNHESAINISELIEKRIPLFKSNVEKKGIKLITNINKNLVIKSDPDAIDQILNNLISNSLKYTPANGEIIIDLNSNNNFIFLKVTDSGDGIPENEIHNIFAAYYQVKNKQNNAGMGVGLNIVKNIVDTLDGKIKIKSNPGKGTIITISIPEHILQDNEKVKKIVTKKPKDSSVIKSSLKDSDYIEGRGNLLIVEDNTDMLYYLANELSNEYNVFIAYDGENALIRLNTIPAPDIIISDIMMDKMDGYNFFNKIKESNRFNAIPFIFLTAKSTEHDKISGLNEGAIDYIYKPFSINELRAKLKSLSNFRKNQRSENLKEAIKAIENKILNPEINNAENLKLTFEKNADNFKLTERQKEIALLIHSGLEYKEISSKLDIATRTVSRHVQDIFEKMNIHNKVEMIQLLFFR